jgi:asparagine synthase (glutamine-hydrolysing)
MCGLSGLWVPSLHAGSEALEACARKMAATVRHRGPDDAGVWSDAGAGLALGHQRLAIVDLSEAGHQPMTSADGRWVLCYNGELYNCEVLRTALERDGVRFRGHSDSEVFVEQVARVGIDASLAMFDGMFAAALWDRREQCLWLLRDPFGEKPLYYARWRGGVLFASELRAFKAVEGYESELDSTALGLYLTYGYVPTPYTIDAHARKLASGSRVCASLADGAVEVHEPVRYFDPATTAFEARQHPLDETEGLAEVAAAFSRSVRGRLLSDVPLGAFLSGGIDSTAVVAEMCAQGDGAVRTFTVGFGEPGYDESPAARAVAAHLGTQHTEFRLGLDEALAQAPTIAHEYDEPFADSSQLPTRLIAAAARGSVTVALTGDGGDELFGGYNRYRAIPRIDALTGGWPAGLRQLAGHGLALASAAPTAPLWRLASLCLPQSRRPRQLREKLAKVAELLPLADSRARYQRVCALNASPARLFGSTVADPRNLPWPKGFDAASWMMLADTLTYLPDDILVKVDRASMSVSLETRTPFLNRELFTAVWRLPTALRIGRERNKPALFALASRHVPAAMLDRPKAGFAIPLRSWLRGPLREWGGDLLSPARIRADGLFDVRAVEQMWTQHQSGAADHAHRLWTLLMFQSWIEQRQ